MLAWAKYLKKTLVAVVTVAAYLAAAGLVPAEYVDEVQALVAALGVFGIYAAENGPKPE